MDDLVRLLLWLAPQNAEARFLVAAVAVVIAGTRLSRYGDIFSEKLRLGQAFVGLMFMALATALPELITSTSCVLVEDAPNLAFGNNYGSILFNLAILFGLELLVTQKSVFALVHPEVLMPAGFSIGIVGIGMTALAIELARQGVTPVYWSVGAGTVVIFAFYLAGAWFLRHHRFEHGGKEDTEAAEYAGVSLGWTVLKYLMAALVIGWAGVNLAAAGDQLAAKYSLSASFVGSIFLAIVTSLPEASATVIMVRRGMYEMAFGNIFGSNAFNVVILAIVDVLERDGYLFKAAAAEPQAASVHLVTGSVAVAITGIVMLAILHKPQRFASAPAPLVEGRAGRVRRAVLSRFSWPSILILLGFLAGAYLAFAVSRG